MVVPHTVPAVPLPARRRLLTGLAAAAAVVLVAVIGFIAGPRNLLGPDTPTPRDAPPAQAAALDAWLAASEARIPDIRPGNAKGIGWRNGVGQRTHWAVVYLHGFSASRLETDPLAEQVAQALGANVYYARLSGHGQGNPDAMGQASAQDWMSDTLEAARIGQTIGEQVLLISCSTGSTLATWLGTGPEAGRIAAHVFISPNFGPKDKRSELINGPWGTRMVLALEGEYRSWKSSTAAEQQAWTTRYPTKALFPMMALVKSVRDSDLSVFQTPLLVLYSEQDQTVDPTETQSAFTRIGSPNKTMESISYSKSRDQHVLAGAIRAPDAVEPMATTISQWAKALPPNKS